MQISGKQLAKLVVIKADDKLVMAVVPASARVDCERLKEALERRVCGVGQGERLQGQFRGL